MRFDEESENFFKFSFHRPIWTGMGILAENFGNFSVPTFHWKRDSHVVRFLRNFVPAPHSHGKDYPINAKIPLPFLAQRCRSGHKKSPQEIPVVVIIPWLFCCPFEVDHRGQSLFRLSFCDYNNITLFWSCQCQVSAISVPL